MKSKLVKESAIENQIYGIFPNDLNAQGTIYGGKVLELIDMIGGIAARRHSEKICVTASIEEKRRFQEAEKRREIRLQRKKRKEE